MSGETAQRESSWTVDTLKVLVERDLKSIREIINELKMSIAKDRSSDETKLILQTTELERRLNALNGEAGRITKVLEASIPREVHERDVKELTGKIDVLTLAGKDYITKDQLGAILKTPSESITSLTSSRDRLGGIGDGWKILLGLLSGAAVVWGFFK